MVVEDCAFGCGSVVVLLAVVHITVVGLVADGCGKYYCGSACGCGKYYCGSACGCGTYYCGSACGGHLALNLSELQALSLDLIHTLSYYC